MKGRKEKLTVLITVKTYPIPSAKYDELVCTAGVTETGDFIRLYPINFRELDYDKQFQKYQWIEVEAVKHTGRDVRKESYRPDSDTISLVEEPLSTDKGTWSTRAQYVLRHEAQSLEDLKDQRKTDRTSLGIFRPKIVKDFVITPDDPEWKPSFLQELKQQRLFEHRKKTLEPPRKVPFKFQYVFECDDSRCRGHTIMIEDWEVGALFWKMVDRGETHDDAAQLVKQKFLDDLCGPKKDTRFFVGTHSRYTSTWLVVGVFYPKKQKGKDEATPSLFE